jgi:SAM-dependent methyltransferase
VYTVVKPENSAELLHGVADYYGTKIRAHGATARGVDWNSKASQLIRFSQLAKIIKTSGRISINDLGCGYGAFFDYLTALAVQVRYRGVDISPDMVEAARLRHANQSRFDASIGDRCPGKADYTVASGIFNVRLAVDDETWLKHFHSSIDHMDAVSTRGFAFNCLTKYSDPELVRPDLFYADPCSVFDRCKRMYSRNVALLHDYGLFEFTILVRKDV